MDGRKWISDALVLIVIGGCCVLRKVFGVAMRPCHCKSTKNQIIFATEPECVSEICFCLCSYSRCSCRGLVWILLVVSSLPICSFDSTIFVLCPAISCSLTPSTEEGSFELLNLPHHSHPAACNAFVVSCHSRVYCIVRDLITVLHCRCHCGASVRL